MMIDAKGANTHDPANNDDSDGSENKVPKLLVRHLWHQLLASGRRQPSAPPSDCVKHGQQCQKHKGHNTPLPDDNVAQQGVPSVVFAPSRHPHADGGKRPLRGNGFHAGGRLVGFGGQKVVCGVHAEVDAIKVLDKVAEGNAGGDFHRVGFRLRGFGY